MKEIFLLMLLKKSSFSHRTRFEVVSCDLLLDVVPLSLVVAAFVASNVVDDVVVVVKAVIVRTVQEG